MGAFFLAEPLGVVLDEEIALNGLPRLFFVVEGELLHSDPFLLKSSI